MAKRRGADYVGLQVHKDFPGFGLYRGRVEHFRRDQGAKDHHVRDEVEI